MTRTAHDVHQKLGDEQMESFGLYMLLVHASRPIVAQNTECSFSAPLYAIRYTNFPFLQRVGQELVHLGDLRRDAEVDCPVANLNDQASNDILVDLLGDLKLLALAELGLSNSSLKSLDCLLVELLSSSQFSRSVCALPSKIPEHIIIQILPERW